LINFCSGAITDSGGRERVHKGFLGTLMLVALAVVLNGCGGSGASGHSAEKGAFIKRADVICDKAEKKKNADIEVGLKEPPKKGTSEIEFQEELVREVALPPIETMVKELKALGPPDDEATEIIQSFESAVEQTRSNPKSVIATEDGAFAKPNKMAKEYGFEACSQI
jgi:hypothetical protein